MSKKYYWLKLQKDFFKRHDIRVLEEQKNGKDYVLFYLKLLLESISHEGNLRFNDTIPYDEDMLAIITNTNIDIVRSAIIIFQKLNLMEIMDDRTIYMSETYKMIGQEDASAKRVREHRERKRVEAITLQSNNDVTKSNIEKELEKEQELDLDIEQEEDKKKVVKKETPPKTPYGEFNRVLLTDEEFKKLQKLFPEHYQKYLQNLDYYLESSNKRYKSHYAVIRQWLSRDGIKEQEDLEWHKMTQSAAETLEKMRGEKDE